MIRDTPTIGIVGCFQNGKSTLVNCLLDDKVAVTGDGLATTRLSTEYSWGEVQSATAVHASLDTNLIIPFSDYISGKNFPNIKLSHFEVNLWKPLLQHINLVDTPGFDACNEDNKTAINSLADLDFVIVVVRNKGLSQTEHNIFKIIAERKLPFALLVNCTEVTSGLWDPKSEANNRICKSIEGSLKSIGCTPHPINGQYVFPVNLAWFWYATQHMDSYDLSESEEDLYDDVQRFMLKKLSISVYGYSEIANRSNFLFFRQTINRIATHYSYSNTEAGIKSLEYIVDSKNFVSKNLDLAMISAERACYIAPEFKPALYNRAIICFERKEYDETIHSTQHLLKIDSRDVETLFLLAKAYFQKKEYTSAKKQLTHITNLLESEWNISWEDSDKISQSNKLIEAYLMKMECEQRDDKFENALKALRYLCYCEQNPLNYVDNRLQLIVWALSSSLELCADNLRGSIASASKALSIIDKNELDSDYEVRLKGFCELFQINTTTIPLRGTKYFLRDDLQRILWKACLRNNKNNLDRAVKEFCQNTIHPVSKSTWIDEPKFIPLFISYAGQKSNIDNIKSYVENYFKATEDVELSNFINTAKQGLSGDILNELMEATKLKCSIEINTVLMMNSVTIINKGLPTLSDLQLNLEYYIDNDKIEKMLIFEGSLKMMSKYKWKGVFEGKKALGSLFGNKKVVDAKLISVVSKQGIVEY